MIVFVCAFYWFYFNPLYLIFLDKMANDGASGPHSMLHVPFEIGHRGQVVVMLVELSVVCLSSLSFVQWTKSNRILPVGMCLTNCS